MGCAKGDVVYVTGNFGALGFHESMNKTRTLQAHLDALKSVLGEKGTVVVPTHSFYLCNTDRVFDSVSTPSERGAFTEYIRCQPGAVRQFHPFASLTAMGHRALEICGNTTRHAYGPNTPYERMLEMGAWGVSVGLPAQQTCSVIHHLEQVMAVPYRYTKEFLQPVIREGVVGKEPFYLFVTYRGCKIQRDRNQKLFQHPALANAVTRIQVGLNQVAGYPMRVLRDAAVEHMSSDIYHWLSQPPENRPYQQ